MKVIVAIVTGLWFLIPSTPSSAQPVDCEAARCTVQAEIDDACPCADAKNHGRYTSCVARVVNRLAREGTIPKKCRNQINGCAIRSTCGKREGVVLCDQAGDGVGGRCRPLSSAAQCEKRGGEIVSSCCDTCGVAPTPTSTATGTTPTPTPATPVPTPSATQSPEGGTPTVEAPTATPTEEAPTATPTLEAPTATPTEEAATATPE